MKKDDDEKDGELLEIRERQIYWKEDLASGDVLKSRVLNHLNLRESLENFVGQSCVTNGGRSGAKNMVLPAN